MKNDTISRQAAIDVVRVMQTHKMNCDNDLILVDKAEVQTELMILPSAERHGHWKIIDKGHHFYDWECSICGGGGRGDYAFCPWCGAKMNEVEK